MWFNGFMLECRFQQVAPKTSERYENSSKVFSPVLDRLKIDFNDIKGNRWTGSRQFRKEAPADALKDRVQPKLRPAELLSTTSINIRYKPDSRRQLHAWTVGVSIFDTGTRICRDLSTYPSQIGSKLNPHCPVMLHHECVRPSVSLLLTGSVVSAYGCAPSRLKNKAFHRSVSFLTSVSQQICRRDFVATDGTARERRENNDA